MNWWNWHPKPPTTTPPTPVPVGLSMHVTIWSPTGLIQNALIAGEMGRPDWTVVGVPLSYYMLSFTAPVGYAYGQPVSLLITATGYKDTALELPFAPDVNVTVPLSK